MLRTLYFNNLIKNLLIFCYIMFSNNNTYLWLVNINKEGAMVYMDNHQYLEHLLQESRKFVANKNNRAIRSLIWDLEEIKTEQFPFYVRFALQIETEIASLKRILRYDLIRNV